MKKLLALLLVFTFCISVCSTSLAEIERDNTKYIYYTNRQRECMAELKQLIQQEVSQIIAESESNSLSPRSGGAHGGSQWKTEYGPTQIKTAEGFAGNQLPCGYRFPTGGSMYYSSSGGPSISLSYSFPTPFGTFGMSVSLGNKTTIGTIVNIPNTTDYFKIYVVNGEWVVYYIGCAYTLYRQSQYAVAV